MICWAFLYFGADTAQGQGQTKLLCFVAGQWETRRVPLPTFHVSISGSILALYGAVLSTITAAAQIIGHFRDRAHIKIRVEPNMEVVGDPSLWGKTFTIVNVANAGRRPITVTNIGAFRLHPADPFVVGMTRPPTPHELKEGKQMTAMIEQKYLESADIEHREVWDATGRAHRLYIAPWYKRWPSRVRRRFSLKRAAKK